MKKLLSIVMLVCIVMSMCTVSAWADKLTKPNAIIQAGSGAYSSVITFNFDDSVLNSDEWKKILTDYGTYGYDFVLTSNKDLPSDSVCLTFPTAFGENSCYLGEISAGEAVKLIGAALKASYGFSPTKPNNIFTAPNFAPFTCSITMTNDYISQNTSESDPLTISVGLVMYGNVNYNSPVPMYNYTITMYPGNNNTYVCTIYDTPFTLTDKPADSKPDPDDPAPVDPNPNPGVNPNPNNPAPVPPAAPVVEDIYYIPATDDNSNMALWSILALALLSTAFVTRKRKNEN